jgi:hypothetical protein
VQSGLTLFLACTAALAITLLTSCAPSKNSQPGSDQSSRVTALNQVLELNAELDDDENLSSEELNDEENDKENEGDLGAHARTDRPSPSLRYVATIDPPRSQMGNPLPLQATAFAFLWDTKYAVVTYNYAGAPIEGALDLVVSAGYNSDTFYRVTNWNFRGAEFNDVVTFEKDGESWIALAGHDEEGAIVRFIRIVGNEEIEVVRDVRVDGFVVTGLRLASDFARSQLIYGVSGNRGAVFSIDARSLESRNFLSIASGASVLDFAGALFALGYESSIGDMGIGPVVDQDFWPTALLNVNRAIDAPARMVSQDQYLYTNVGNRLRTFEYRNSPNLRLARTSGRVGGTSNGLDVYDTHLMLAQGERGAIYYDLIRPNRPKRVGRIDFRDDRGSANQIKIGPQYQHPDNTLAFISVGIGGVRLVEIRRQ